MNGFASQASAETAVARLTEIYEASVANLRAALERFAVDGVPPEAEHRARGAFVYPELRVSYRPNGAPPKVDRAFARFNQAGLYSVTITRPDLFRAYLLEQLGPLIADYGAQVEVGPSTREIPYPYVLDGADLSFGTTTPQELSRHFPTTNLVDIGDELVDGLRDQANSPHLPLALFDAPRTDFSLARLRHYTGTPLEHFQSYVLFTNYHRYVDEFVRFAAAKLAQGDEYEGLLRGWCDAPARDGQCQLGRGRFRVAPAPDARLPSRGQGRAGHQPGQHRRRTCERQDHHRSPRSLAPRSVV